MHNPNNQGRTLAICNCLKWNASIIIKHKKIKSAKKIKKVEKSFYKEFIFIKRGPKKSTT